MQLHYTLKVCTFSISIFLVGRRAMTRSTIILQDAGSFGILEGTRIPTGFASSDLSKELAVLFYN